MVLENYVILKTGVPARVHFTDHYIETRTVTDRSTGLPTSRRVLIFEDRHPRRPRCGGKILNHGGKARRSIRALPGG